MGFDYNIIISYFLYKMNNKRLKQNSKRMKVYYSPDSLIQNLVFMTASLLELIPHPVGKEISVIYDTQFRQTAHASPTPPSSYQQ
jgi:hypothetical protein